jgi:hypothetical protein
MGLFDIFSSAPGQKAAADQTSMIQQGLHGLERQFGQGRGALTTDYAAALSPYTQNYANASQGMGAYGNALGLGGAAGNASALAGFQNNPGYQFQLDQGLNSVLANQARTGQMASGNTDLALQQMGNNLANQGWNQYIQNLQPYLGAANQAASGIAGVNTGLGNAMNQSYQGQGNAIYGADTSIGKAQAGGDMAGYNASGNIIGAGLGALNSAGKIAGAFA